MIFIIYLAILYFITYLLLVSYFFWTKKTLIMRIFSLIILILAGFSFFLLASAFWYTINYTDPVNRFSSPEQKALFEKNIQQFQKPLTNNQQ
jgi:energy-coupling factor transporter transmembrane protein EcfT